MVEQNPFSDNSLTGNSDLADFIALAAAKIEKLHSAVIYEFGPNGVYIMGAFIGFLTIILLIYIKSVIDTFRIADGESDDAGLFYTQDNQPAENLHSVLADEAEELMENEKPRLTIDADFQALSEKDKLEKEKEISRVLVQSSAVTDDILQLKAKLKEQAEKNSFKPLDWQKNDLPQHEQLADDTALNYEQQKESMNELISLIINMLSREVSPEKIAQAVYYRNHGETEKEEILQTISAVRDFISLCTTGKFNSLPARNELPSDEEAVLAWAHGDSSYCLNLLENLIKQQIDSAESKDKLVKDIAYAQASSYACLFGTITGADNLDLAQNSFELALELAPKSINAWSRCGDIYWQQKDYDKAVYAYQTVVEGDDILYAQQIANAQHKLALYYAQSGKNDTAENLEQDSLNYYQNYGINTALSEQENENLNYIADYQQQNLRPSVIKLLQTKQAQYA